MDYISRNTPPKLLIFRVLYCLRLSISSNFMGLVWHIRILILPIFYANVHKILQISYFFLEKLAFGDIFSHYSIFGFSGTAVVNILFCRLACSDILKWDGRTSDALCLYICLLMFLRCKGSVIMKEWEINYVNQPISLISDI